MHSMHAVSMYRSRTFPAYSNIVSCTPTVINVFRLMRQEIVCAYFNRFGGEKMVSMPERSRNETKKIAYSNCFVDADNCHPRQNSTCTNSDIIYNFICVSQTQKDILFFTLGFYVLPVHFRWHDNDEWTTRTTNAEFKIYRYTWMKGHKTHTSNRLNLNKCLGIGLLPSPNWQDQTRGGSKF